jgi:DNA-binding LytR/AlgR family response regulator
MLKILIVEDELIIAEDMQNMLTKMGYEVVGNAMDAEEALEILATETPDLMLLDINLGGKKDGIDLANEINEKYQVPFIFTTSHTDSATVQRAKITKPINYLVKPFKAEQLYTAIEIAMINLAKNEEPNLEKETPKIDAISAPLGVGGPSFHENEEGLIIKDALFIKDKYRYTKLQLSDILWIKAEGNYLELHLAERKELIRNSLSSFLEKVNKPNFFRTNKSFAVNLDYLTSFEPTQVIILKTPIPIAKPNADELLKRLDVV